MCPVEQSWCSNKPSRYIRLHATLKLLIKLVVGSTPGDFYIILLCDLANSQVTKHKNIKLLLDEVPHIVHVSHVF